MTKSFITIQLRAFTAFCILYTLLFLIGACKEDTERMPPDEEVNKEVIAYWPLNGNGKDSSGNGHTATLYNLVPTTDRFGYVNGALYFNGTNGYANAVDKAALRLNNTDFTINAWVKLDVLHGHVLSKRIAGADNGWHTSISGKSPIGVLTFGPGGGSTNAWGSKSVGVNAWHMVTSVYNLSEGTLSFYIDGVLDNTTSGILSPNNAITAMLYIGKDEPTNTYLKGAMDDIEILRKALSSTEVKQLYEGSKGIPNDLIAYWPFDGSGKDSTGNGNHASPHNLIPTTDRFCRPGRAYYFNGTTSYARVVDNPALRLHNTDFTLTAWLKLDSYDESYGTIIMSKRIPGANTGWQTSIAGYQSHVLGTMAYGPGGGSINAWGTKKVTLNGWHMVTSVYKLSDQTLSIYIDGEFDNITSGILTPNGTITSPLHIGKDQATEMYFLKGALDDIQIYGKALSTEEVKALYMLTKGGCNLEQ